MIVAQDHMILKATVQLEMEVSFFNSLISIEWLDVPDTEDKGVHKTLNLSSLANIFI